MQPTHTGLNTRKQDVLSKPFSILISGFCTTFQPLGSEAVANLHLWQICHCIYPASSLKICRLNHFCMHCVTTRSVQHTNACHACRNCSTHLFLLRMTSYALTLVTGFTQCMTWVTMLKKTDINHLEEKDLNFSKYSFWLAGQNYPITQLRVNILS